jgi:hypothetical protein
LPDNEQLSFLDILTIISFIVGLANYSENVSQGAMQEAVHSAVEEIHLHLEEQDEKLNWILSLLEAEK